MQIKVRLVSRPIQRWARLFSKQTLLRAARVMGPTPVALTFAGVAHAEGTMDFSGAQTLMGTFKIMTVSAREFLRRFLLHVLPGGLVRIRHFGLCTNRRRSAALERCRTLLGMAACVDRPEPPTLRCPDCFGIMLFVEGLTRGQLYFGAGLAASLPRRLRDDTS